MSNARLIFAEVFASKMNWVTMETRKERGRPSLQEHQWRQISAWRHAMSAVRAQNLGTTESSIIAKTVSVPYMIFKTM